MSGVRRLRNAGFGLLFALGVSLAASEACGKPAAASSRSLSVYFSNSRLAGGTADCAAVFPVKRSTPRTAPIATTALRLLFTGPTPAEMKAGYRSLFSPGTSDLLKRVTTRRGVAYVDLNDRRQALSNATSSCGAAEFQSQITNTLRRLPGIKKVIFAIDGEPRTFYEWMNEACSRANGNCDARPFKRRGG